MATRKRDAKRVRQEQSEPVTGSVAAPEEVTGPAPVEVVIGSTKEIIVRPSLQGAKPVIIFSGVWHTREVRTILRSIPRAFRLHQQHERKNGSQRHHREEVLS
jgi:hypothetical protein